MIQYHLPVGGCRQIHQKPRDGNFTPTKKLSHLRISLSMLTRQKGSEQILQIE